MLWQGNLIRAAAVTAVAGALAIGVAGVADASPQSWYPATVGGASSGGGVSLRDCYHPQVNLPPSTNCTYLKTVPTGTGVNIVCQRAGQNIGGDNVWDYVVYSGGEGFMSDYYLFTNHDNWIPGVDVCQ